MRWRRGAGRQGLARPSGASWPREVSGWRRAGGADPGRGPGRGRRGLPHLRRLQAAGGRALGHRLAAGRARCRRVPEGRAGRGGSAECRRRGHGILVPAAAARGLDPSRSRMRSTRQDVTASTPRTRAAAPGRPPFAPCTAIASSSCCAVRRSRSRAATRYHRRPGPARRAASAVLLSAKAPGANATVTLCHTGTRDLAGFTRQADVAVAAAGRPAMITPDWSSGRGRGRRRQPPRRRPIVGDVAPDGRRVRRPSPRPRRGRPHDRRPAPGQHRRRRPRPAGRSG